MDLLLQDLRYAVRTLRTSPGFTAVAVLTLALGIGANTAIFSIIDTVLLRPLPYPHPERLVRVFATSEGEEWTVAPPDFVEWRTETSVFEEIAAYDATSYALTGRGDAERLQAARVTSGFFRVLGVTPAMGRAFLAEDAVGGRNRMVVLSHGLWQRRFGGDPGAVGGTARLDGADYTVVGVMPAGFEYPKGTELWAARAFTAEELADGRGSHFLDVVARLRPGTTEAEAAAQVRAIAARLEAEYPETNAGWSASVQGLHQALVGDVRPALWILLGAVGLVLLIACANVANLSLARALGREDELAIRTALGAARGRIARGLLTEGLLLGLAGGVLGVFLAQWGVDLLGWLQANDVPRADQVQIDGRVLVFAAAASLLTGVLFGLAPALTMTLHSDVKAGLRDGRRAGAGGVRTRSALVVSEIALAVLLLAGAGLLMRSFVNLMRVDSGFAAANVLTFDLSLPEERYSDPQQAEAFFAELLGRIEALPGVEQAGGVFGLPLSGFRYGTGVEEVDGRRAYDDPSEQSVVQVRVATADYFSTLGCGCCAAAGFPKPTARARRSSSS